MTKPRATPKKTPSEISKAKSADIDALWNQWWVMQPGAERTALTAKILAMHKSGEAVSAEDDDAEDD